MQLNYATVIEAMADKLGDTPCLYYGDEVIGWKEYESRGSSIARCLIEHGLSKDSKVGLFLYNCPEYMEATLAAFKIRGVPININYRYLGDELFYLLEDCGAEALIFNSSLGDRVAEIRNRLPRLKVIISVDDGGKHVDGALPYEELVSTLPPAERIERSHTDTMMLYTGGTTGMPKGVEFNVGDMLLQFVQFIPAVFGYPETESLEGLVEQAVERAERKQSLVSLPASPLMHTAGILNSGMLVQLFGGAMVILKARAFDPIELWQSVQKFKVNHMVVVGDTFVKPMLQALEDEKERGTEYDISSLKIIVSSGVIFSRPSKEKLLELGDMMILDGAGATEGAMGIQICSRNNPPTDTAHFIAQPTTEIFDEDYRLLPRGSGQVGYIGMGGTLPRGYYKDSEKSAKTFRVIDGKRYGFTGDMGSIDADGTLKFKGRGSNCINTGGEKVFPEEVEEVIKQHPCVKDCLVVGLPDDRFGQRVAAVVSLKAYVASPFEELKAFCGQRMAGYKLPRTVKVVERVERSPNGKADYKWALASLAEGQ